MSSALAGGFCNYWTAREPSVVVCYSERMQVTVGMGQWPGDFPTQLEDSLARGVTRTALASPGTSVRWRAWGWQPWVSPSLGVQGFPGVHHSDAAPAEEELRTSVA